MRPFLIAFPQIPALPSAPPPSSDNPSTGLLYVFGFLDPLSGVGVPFTPVPGAVTALPRGPSRRRTLCRGSIGENVLRPFASRSLPLSPDRDGGLGRSCSPVRPFNRGTGLGLYFGRIMLVSTIIIIIRGRWRPPSFPSSHFPDWGYGIWAYLSFPESRGPRRRGGGGWYLPVP